jgi:hypothetical protein
MKIENYEPKALKRVNNSLAKNRKNLDSSLSIFKKIKLLLSSLFTK